MKITGHLHNHVGLTENFDQSDEVRYYCAAKKGYYTMKQTVKLNNYIQQVDFKY